jgi:hypothetical protein
MPEWLLAIVLWFIGLAGLHELPPAGGCVPAPGPAFVSAAGSEHRPMCVDAWGTMREQAGSR